jgi:multisubunit Na+/H+ antiporter MnhG subunit
MFNIFVNSYHRGRCGTISNKGGVMLAAIAAVLLVLWLLGFIAFHVTFGAIHLLLVIAVVLFVAHFLSGRKAAV